MLYVWTGAQFPLDTPLGVDQKAYWLGSYHIRTIIKLDINIFLIHFLFRWIVTSLLDQLSVVLRFTLAQCIKEGGSDLGWISLGDGIQ